MQGMKTQENAFKRVFVLARMPRTKYLFEKNFNMYFPS